MRKHLTRVTLLVGVAALARLASAATGSARPFAGSVSGPLDADGSSTLGPYVHGSGRGLRAREQGREASSSAISGTGGGFERFCKGETDLANASRPIKLLRGGEVPGRRHPLHPVPRRQRRPLAWSTRAEHVGELPHRRRAQEGLGPRIEGQQLEGRPRRLPGRPAEALRPGHGLRHVRLLHREDQRPAPRRAAPTTPRARTTTCSSAASRATAARWATSATRTTSRTRASSRCSASTAAAGASPRASRPCRPRVQAALAAAVHLRQA